MKRRMGKLLFLVVLAQLSSCTNHSNQRREKIASVSQKAIVLKCYSDQECLSDYYKKIDQPQHAHTEYTRKKLNQMKLEFLLVSMRSLQNMVLSMDVPLLSSAVNHSIEKTIGAYYSFERMNKLLERKTGFSVEVEEDSAELQFSKAH